MRNTVVGMIILAFVAANGCTPKAGPAVDTDRPNPLVVTEPAVRAVISKQFNVDAAAIPMDQPISNPPLKADALDLVEIVMELEDQFGIVIADSTIDRESGRLFEGPIRITPNQLLRIAREAPRAQQSKREK